MIIETTNEAWNVLEALKTDAIYDRILNLCLERFAADYGSKEALKIDTIYDKYSNELWEYDAIAHLITLDDLSELINKIVRLRIEKDLFHLNVDKELYSAAYELFKLHTLSPWKGETSEETINCLLDIMSNYLHRENLKMTANRLIFENKELSNIFDTEAQNYEEYEAAAKFHFDCLGLQKN